MHPDDERLAQLLRLIRKRTGHTQSALARAAAVPRRDVLRIEAGHADQVSLGRIRRVLEAAGGRGRFIPWWNGAAADRLLDERHAALVERTVAVFAARGWQTHVELSFSEFGERGSIDVLGVHPSHRAAAVVEVKSVISSLEETNRMLDVKERLAPKLIFRRFGWRPLVVARILVVPRDNGVRRAINRHPATMDAVYPARAREIRAWLRHPSEPLRGIWFVSEIPDADQILV